MDSAVESSVTVGDGEVLARGLVTREDLNGQQGRVKSWDPSRGRFAVEFPSGESAWVKPENLERVPNGSSGKCCEVCSKPGKKSCARCELVRYCSRDCQKLHWREHKPNCRAPVGPEALASADHCPECQNPWVGCDCLVPPRCMGCEEGAGDLIRGCACRGPDGY